MRNEKVCDCRDCRRAERAEKMVVYGIVWPFMICALIFCFVVIKSAYGYERHAPKEPQVWTGPEIPKCDKELWLRIKDGCKDD